MIEKVIMPKTGMAMEEGTITEWLVKEGDSVSKGDILAVIETDKATMELEAETDGQVLKIKHQAGSIVPVTQVIAYIGQPGDQIPPEDSRPDVQADVSHSLRYDLVIIGGGPAGYVAAIKAGQSGGKVALVEKDTLGGTCLNRGCIPTKAYLKNAEIVQEIKNAKARGIVLKDPSPRIDMPATLKMKNRIVKKLTSGVGSLLSANGVEVIHGDAVLQADKRVLINNQQSIQGNKVLIASGSKVATVPVPGIESQHILTSDDILSSDTIPESLTIIGGGVVGVEMAIIFNAFGTKVNIIEMEPRLLPFMDSDISKFTESTLEKNGISIHKGAHLESIREVKDGLQFKLSSGETLTSQKGLLSAGRVADTDVIGDQTIDLDKGFIRVNEYLETSVPGIYAAGDVTGRKMLAHEAFKMGEVAAENALGAKKKADLRYVPSVVYSIPEVASVGLNQADIPSTRQIKVGYFPLTANGRALAVGESDGFVKVITDTQFGEVLGVHIAGPGASEIINEAAALMAMEITSHEIADTIHGHPTIGEAFMEAAADSLNRCIHLPPEN